MMTRGYSVEWRRRRRRRRRRRKQVRGEERRIKGREKMEKGIGREGRR